MAGPFKMKGWDPFGRKAKKELEVRKQLDKTVKQIDETSQKAKDLSTKWKEEDKPKKPHRPPGTSDSYQKKHGTGPYAPKTETKQTGPGPKPPTKPPYDPYKLPGGKFKKTKGKLKRS